MEEFVEGALCKEAEGGVGLGTLSTSLAETSRFAWRGSAEKELVDKVDPKDCPRRCGPLVIST